MKNKNIKKIYVFVIFSMFFGASVISSTGNNQIEHKKNMDIETDIWWNTDWSYRKQITIDHTQVDDDLENFPVLVSCESDDFIGHTQNDGDDFVFVDNSNTVQYNHEIEYYDFITGELIAWINILDISSTDDTIFWIYYGNPDCSNQQNPELVWDSNYIMVQHMNGINALDIDDSTSNNNDVIDNSGCEFQQNGKIGYAVDFERSDEDYLLVDDDNSLDVNDEFTIEAWVKVEDWHDVLEIIGKSENVDPNVHMQFHFNIQGDYDKRRLYIATREYGVGNPMAYSDQNSINLDTWHYCVGVSNDGGLFAVYLDSIIGSTTDIDNINDCTNNIDLGIGTYSNLYHGPAYYGFDGLIDEIRISNIPRSEEWIVTSYNNLEYPFSFLSIGPEEKFELKSVIIIGKINNINNQGDFITFNAERIRLIQFSPFQFIQYTSGEEIQISKDYVGILATKFILGVFKVV